MLALILAASVASAQPETFNLNCSGTLQTLVPSLLRDKSEPYAITYRIDLAAGKWCEGECGQQDDIARVTPLAIVLADHGVDTPREHEQTHAAISRETGHHSIIVISGVGRDRMMMSWSGECEKAPFTGFPKAETKF